MKKQLTFISALLIALTSLLPTYADTTTEQVKKAVEEVATSAEATSSDSDKKEEMKAKEEGTKKESTNSDSADTKKKKAEGDEEPECE